MLASFSMSQRQCRYKCLNLNGNPHMVTHLFYLRTTRRNTCSARQFKIAHDVATVAMLLVLVLACYEMAKRIREVWDQCLCDQHENELDESARSYFTSGGLNCVRFQQICC